MVMLKLKQLGERMKALVLFFSVMLGHSALAASKCTEYKRLSPDEFKVIALAFNSESIKQASIDAQHEAEVCALDYCERATAYAIAVP